MKVSFALEAQELKSLSLFYWEKVDFLIFLSILVQ